MSRRTMYGLLLTGSLVSAFSSITLTAADPVRPSPAKPSPREAVSAPAAPGAAAGAPSAQSALLKELEKAYAGTTPPESVRMLLAISRGSRMGPGEGWFGPADARYTWQWLAKKHGIPETAGIPADTFLGPKSWFARLDRNQDGQITAEDLDWSDRNAWAQQTYMVNRMFRRMETTGDGKLTRDEWLAFFDKATRGNDHLKSEDLRDALIGGVSPSSFLAGDAPSQEMLIRGLFAGEIGSLNEGPRLNARAPDFTLVTHDGTRSVRLADYIGKKPIVLTFGNFTCGPFRSMFPGVEDVHKRFNDDAVFLSVYVREAHPTDGWKMESNNRVGVAVPQPRTFAERAAVATQCHDMLKPAMPLLVDEINDAVGNAYSGMPARLYVIDREGKVAYKGGRGPFGFKSGEMEQALIMTLLDESSATSK